MSLYMYQAVRPPDGVCITAPQMWARALLQACWSVGPGRGGTLRRPA